MSDDKQRDATIRGEAARRGGEAKPRQSSQFFVNLSSTLLLYLSLSLSPDTSRSLSLYSNAIPVLLLRQINYASKYVVLLLWGRSYVKIPMGLISIC